MTVELAISIALNLILLGALIWQRIVIGKLSTELHRLYAQIGERTMSQRSARHN